MMEIALKDMRSSIIVFTSVQLQQVVKKGLTNMGVSTGIILIDLLIRPLLRFGFKFYYVGFGLLFLVYGFIAYTAVKSAYLSDRN